MSKIIRRTRENLRQTNREVVFQTLTLMTSAFAFVAALAWNEAVKALIDHFFPAASGLYSRFIYAIIITLLVVLVTRHLGRLSKRFGEEPAAAEEQTKE